MSKKDIIISGLIAVVIILVILVLLLPQSDPQEDREYLEPIDTTQADIDSCIRKSQFDYQNKWEIYCDTNNIPKYDGWNCSIPVVQANFFNAELARAKELCVERYK